MKLKNIYSIFKRKLGLTKVLGNGHIRQIFKVRGILREFLL